MRWTRMAMLALVVCGLLAPAALAQRGVGDSVGVAQRADLPEVVTLKGTVVQVETGPCENTTGRSFVGTHFLLKDSKSKTLNIHLGPTDTVAFVAKELSEGKKVKVEAFRTKQMKKGHYVAQTITCEGRAVTLRDATFRPAWAGGVSAADARGWSARGPGRGAEVGRGRGYGAGRGRGQGRGQGQGQGWGRGQGGGGYRAATDQCPRFGAWYLVPEAKASTD
jgi:hypothetical protein